MNSRAKSTWIVAGVILTGLELVAPGAFLIWLGIAALLTGLVLAGRVRVSGVDRLKAGSQVPRDAALAVDEAAGGQGDQYCFSHGLIAQAMRISVIQYLVALLLLSQGVPMICGGDEIGRTQQGNNNTYCQDNEISWIDWSLLDRHADLIRFVE